MSGRSGQSVADRRRSSERSRSVDHQYAITTAAGNGAFEFSGDGGLATHAGVALPRGVAIDAVGNVYIADLGNNRVRKVDSGGRISTVAGNGTPGFSGDGGPATKAQLDGPTGVAVDSRGNLCIADNGNKRLRVVGADTQQIQTVVGSGKPGDPGIDVIDVAIISPDITKPSAGIYITDGRNSQVLRVDTYHKTTPLPTNGGLKNPSGIAADSAGNLYVADTGNRRVCRLGPDPDAGGDPTTVVDGLDRPLGVAVDSGGGVYVTDEGANQLCKVEAGAPVPVAGNGTSGWNGDGTPATAFELAGPAGAAAHPNGNVYVADLRNNRVRRTSAASVPAADFTVKQPDWPPKLDLVRGTTKYPGVRVDYVSGTDPVPAQTVVVTLPPGRGLAFVPEHGTKCTVTVQPLSPPAIPQPHDAELSGDLQTLTVHNVDLVLSPANVESAVWVAVTAVANAPLGISQLTYAIGGKRSGSTPVDVM